MSRPPPFVLPQAAAALLVGVLALVASARLDAAEAAAYGAKVTFAKSRPIAFPDFQLEYRGSRRATSPQFPRGFVVHDFVATRGSERVPVSWSAGTGDIGPAVFVASRKTFWLELAVSDTLGRLKPTQLVITDKGPAS